MSLLAQIAQKLLDAQSRNKDRVQQFQSSSCTFLLAGWARASAGTGLHSCPGAEGTSQH